jgi:hypothetical protein
MVVKKLDYIEDNANAYKKSSNIFIGATFAVMIVIIMVGMIFG